MVPGFKSAKIQVCYDSSMLGMSKRIDSYLTGFKCARIQLYLDLYVIEFTCARTEVCWDSGLEGFNCLRIQNVSGFKVGKRDVPRLFTINTDASLNLKILTEVYFLTL